ncbi:hypothetical protein NPS01_25050 [Nocardioides psychrotolerans]|nr:helix-turn-helix transcriptional regulator [Nocardioides psychrotolerans]GEP38842.1 hypothetical protein NPS01_25050 [Nocardioides psychrotolerans]
MEHDRSARKRLGRAVRAARQDAGYANREDFAAQVGRSARQVQALENGETGVGPDTYAAVAKVLDWKLDKVYAYLEGEQPGSPVPPSLTVVSDDQLLAEIARRFARAEQRERGEPGGDTTATTVPAREPAPPHLRVAARDIGEPSRGQRKRAALDELGEEHQGDAPDGGA